MAKIETAVQHKSQCTPAGGGQTWNPTIGIQRATTRLTSPPFWCDDYLMDNFHEQVGILIFLSKE